MIDLMCGKERLGKLGGWAGLKRKAAMTSSVSIVCLHLPEWKGRLTLGRKLGLSGALSLFHFCAPSAFPHLTPLLKKPRWSILITTNQLVSCINFSWLRTDPIHARYQLLGQSRSRRFLTRASWALVDTWMPHQTRLNNIIQPQPYDNQVDARRFGI